MFDIGWSELLLIGIVALIVIGPKDLPEMFRTLGRFTAKARGMAREFSRAMEAAADEAGVKDVARDIKAAADPKGMGIDAVKEAARKFENWDLLKTQRPPPNTALGPKVADAAAKPPSAEAVAAKTPAADAAAKPMGPATQALADAQAARRAAGAAPAAAPPKDAAE